MRIINSLGLVTLAIIFVGCTATREVAEGQRVERSFPKNVAVVLLEVADLDRSAVRNVAGLANADELYVSHLKDALVAKHQDWRVGIRRADTRNARHDVVIANEILLVDGGSAAKRFWIGFGAGAIVSKVNVKIRDAQGQLVAESDISQKTTCPMGACTDDQTSAVQDNIKELANSVAEFVTEVSKH